MTERCTKSNNHPIRIKNKYFPYQFPNVIFDKIPRNKGGKGPSNVIYHIHLVAAA